MKIALCSSAVPFIQGGYRHIVDWLDVMLREAGHQVEVIYLPEVDSPDTLFRQMCAFRWVHLESADRIICFRPQSHLIPHPHKILWFIHHIRAFYDLWNHPQYSAVPDTPSTRGFRDALRSVDTRAMREAQKIFTNSQVVSDRIKKFNGLDSEVLYPPIFRSERYRCLDWNDEIVCICRMEHHKRQHLLIQAMAHVQAPVTLRLCGPSSGRYPEKLKKLARKLGVSQRVVVDNRWISEEEKVELFGTCLAAAYLPLDEDSYGYPTLEAAHASKPLVSTFDAGGVNEFVTDGQNGYLTSPDPQLIAKSIEALYRDRQKTIQMGETARTEIDNKGITWAHALERLLA